MAPQTLMRGAGDEVHHEWQQQRSEIFFLVGVDRRQRPYYISLEDGAIGIQLVLSWAPGRWQLDKINHENRNKKPLFYKVF